jgi:hypothetical protein
VVSCGPPSSFTGGADLIPEAIAAVLEWIGHIGWSIGQVFGLGLPDSGDEEDEPTTSENDPSEDG